ncbi:MAG: PIN domain-containing protein [Burkholderiaceae bacterium]|nr:PIN domain-containing protein [Burkholderiaceae bacterium]
MIDLFDTRSSNGNKPRLDLLMKDFEQSREKIGVPAPAYTEFLIGSGSARGAYQARIENMSRFSIEPFSTRAAMECSILLTEVFSKQQQKAIGKTKLKFDWMIVATAKAMNATCMYTCDGDIKRACERISFPYVMINTLALPPESPQGKLFFEGAPEA